MPITDSSAAHVYYNGVLAGTLTRSGKSYTFRYDPAYLINPSRRPVSITLPLREEAYVSDTLFPAFINRLSEGANKHLQSRLLKIDENDYFSLLLATGDGDTIGPVTIKPVHAAS